MPSAHPVVSATETPKETKPDPASEPGPEPVAVAAPVSRDESVTAELRVLLGESSQLAALDDDQRESVARLLEGPHDFPEGAEVLGALVASEYLLLIESGEVVEGERKLRRGDCMGDLSLLRGVLPPSPAVAGASSRLWRLSKRDFDEHVASALNERNESRCSLLGRAGVLSTLSDIEMYRLAHHSEELHLIATEEPILVSKQGETSSSLLIVVSGSVECWQVDAGGTDILTATLGDGDVAEETALLGDKKTSATLKVPGEARLLRLERSVVVREVGPLETLLKRNMEVYAKYMPE